MKILIFEDEKLASEKLEKMLLEIEPQANVIAKIQTVAGAIEWLRSNTLPNLILSDIRLLDGLCFEIFEQVKVNIPVIFTTAYDQYAIKAFEVNSIDYLLKPVQKDKLRASLEKLKQRVETAKPATSNIDYHEVIRMLRAAPSDFKSRFMVKLGQKIIALPADKIAYFFSENKLTYIVSKDGKRYPMDQPLDELMVMLDPRMFFRINRQYIVTFESIAEIHPYFKGRIKLILNPKTEEDVVISSERTPEFKKWIDQ